MKIQPEKNQIDSSIDFYTILYVFEINCQHTSIKTPLVSPLKCHYMGRIQSDQ